MALFTVDFDSVVLHRMVSLCAYLPSDRYETEESNNAGALINKNKFYNSRDTKYKTLYLLHGLTDNNKAWITNTRILRLAKEHNIAVIMPSGENSFYINQPQPHNDYGRYIGEELVEATRRMFPLSDKREDTFIGGLSMGGFGALRNGLVYADTFGSIIALSSAIHMFELKPDNPNRSMLFGEDAVLGEWEEAANTDKNPAFALKRLQEKVLKGEAEFPRVYMSCGTEDGLLGANRSFAEKLKSANVPVLYKERPGIHDWPVWDEEIETALVHILA